MNLNIKFVNKKERDWKNHDVIQYTERVPYKKNIPYKHLTLKS